MDFAKRNWKWLLAGVSGVAIIAYAASADAADLSGACCADLEERIAEIEATTARKGTKSTSLSIYGQINKGIFYYDVEDFSDTSIVENGASETFVGFSAKVQISKGFAAGGVVEFGQGKSGIDIDLLSGSAGIGTDNDIYARQSYVFVTTEAGRVSVGLQSMATDDFMVPSVANTSAATKRLTLQPVGSLIVSIGPITLLDLELEPFNGKKADSIRYDSPVFAGFSASAAWESGSDSWDAALRYAAELGGFQVLASAGYEVDKSDELLGLLGLETKTIMFNGGVKHVASGIFAQGSWARLEVEQVNVETDVWHAQAGWEGKLFAFGPTTVWGGYSDWSDVDFKTYELGVNQSLAGGIDAYLVGRQIELGDVEASSLLGGMRVRF